MNKNKPLDQMRSTGVNAPNRTSKLVNKSEFNGSILNRLMNFARSVPDFRRSGNGKTLSSASRSLPQSATCWNGLCSESHFPKRQSCGPRSC